MGGYLFLGAEFDSQTMTMKLPEEKLQRLKVLTDRKESSQKEIHALTVGQQPRVSMVRQH